MTDNARGYGWQSAKADRLRKPTAKTQARPSSKALAGCAFEKLCFDQFAPGRSSKRPLDPKVLIPANRLHIPPAIDLRTLPASNRQWPLCALFDFSNRLH
jgi:hypothetical protein